MQDRQQDMLKQLEHYFADVTPPSSLAPERVAERLREAKKPRVANGYRRILAVAAVLVLMLAGVLTVWARGGLGLLANQKAAAPETELAMDSQHGAESAPADPLLGAEPDESQARQIEIQQDAESGGNDMVYGGATPMSVLAILAPVALCAVGAGIVIARRRRGREV